jgi:hypothetical protein
MRISPTWTPLCRVPCWRPGERKTSGLDHSSDSVAMDDQGLIHATSDFRSRCVLAHLHVYMAQRAIGCAN